MNIRELINQLDPYIRKMIRTTIPGVVYGSMWGDDIAQVVTVASATVVYAVGGGLSTGLCNGMTFQNARELLCVFPGKYACSWSMSLRPASNGDQVGGSVMVNATQNHTLEGSAYFQVASHPLCVSGHGVLTLAAGDVVKLAVENETSASNITVDHASLVLTSVGE